MKAFSQPRLLLTRVVQWVPGAAMLALAAAGSAHAQQGGWRPERPAEFVVAVSAGGATDYTARFMQKIIQTHRLMETPVVIANKPGGGGNLALNYLDQHAGDGHFLLNSTLTVMTNQILGLSKIHYTDYTAVALLFNEHATLVVPANSPIRSVRDIMQKLKADPQALSVATGFAIGGINHLGVGQLLKQGGIDARRLKTVVFQGQGAVLTALLGGHVDFAPMQVAAAVRGAQEGKLRVLGIAAERRGDGALADIPTWREQGLDLVWSNVRFVIGPKGMTPAQLAFWDHVLGRVTQSEEWKDEGRRNFLQLEYLNSRQTPQRLAQVYEQLRNASITVGLIKE